MSQSDKKTPTDKSDGQESLSVERPRRKFLSGVAGVTGVAAGTTWVTPVVESVVLPAHAQTTPLPLFGFNFKVQVAGSELSDADDDRIFADGTHTITLDGGGDLDNLDMNFWVEVDPNPDVEIGAVIDVNVTYSGAVNVDSIPTAASVTVPANVDPAADAAGGLPEADIDIEGDGIISDATPLTVSARARSPGFPTRRITLIVVDS